MTSTEFSWNTATKVTMRIAHVRPWFT